MYSNSKGAEICLVVHVLAGSSVSNWLGCKDQGSEVDAWPSQFALLVHSDAVVRNVRKHRAARRRVQNGLLGLYVARSVV